MTSEPTTDTGNEPNLARPGSITYMQIPAPDPRAAGAFYAAVFGWNIRGDDRHLSFDDRTGNVSGAFVRERAISREPGILPYVYVDSVDDTLVKAAAHGAQVVTPRYDEGNLWVATIRDPSGNVIGVWQMQP